MDQIIGVSVLQPTWIPGIYRLWFRAKKGTGETNQGWIFIHDRATVGMPAKMPDYPEGTNSLWQFTKRADGLLDCSPSVNWVSWSFHNGGQWVTNYVEMTVAMRSQSKAGDDEGPEPPRYHFGSAVHSDINHEVRESGQRLIEELKQQGILL